MSVNPDYQLPAGVTYDKTTGEYKDERHHPKLGYLNLFSYFEDSLETIKEKHQGKQQSVPCWKAPFVYTRNAVQNFLDMVINLFKGVFSCCFPAKENKDES